MQTIAKNVINFGLLPWLNSEETTMNKIYKVIYSKTLGCLVVVSESAKCSGGKKTARRKLVSLVATSSLLSMPVFAGALPTGGQVVSGAASISSNGSAMTVNQSTDKMIANWQSFSIGAGNSVTFKQPSVSSVALNRVVGQDASQILGNLNANGQVFLINPNGVAIGASGSVQTGGFIASTLDITNENFLSGNYQFTGIGGSISNKGNISGRIVALISPSVTNEGSINYRSTNNASTDSISSVALAAGTDVLLDFDGDGLLSVEVKANTLAGLVENKGLIQTDGGVAILTAKGASDALKGVVNNSGTIQANTIASQNGRILLLGDMSNGEVNVAGSLKANFVETSAATVNIDQDLKVNTNGGEWLIDPVNITIDASKASAIETALASGNVTVSTEDGVNWAGETNGTGTDEGNITVDASMDWNANTLTLRADNDITINAELTSTGTTSSDGLVLQYAQTTSTGDYSINAPVNLAAGSLFQTKKGSDAAITYTVITGLGSEGSTAGTDLQGINGDLGGYYVLGANIDASDTVNWDSGAGFSSLGGLDTYFTGIFEGLGHTISDLTINRPSTDGIGLFGSVSGTIRNVGLTDISVTGHDYVGGLALASDGGSISHVYTTGSVSGNQYVGGLLAVNGMTLIALSNVYSTANVEGYKDVGGLVGINYGIINNTYATGNITGTISVSESSNIGGLVGSNQNGLGIISNSYATGDVTGYQSIGGLVGYSHTGDFSNVYATGHVVGGYHNVGGLVGYDYAGIINNAYATGLVEAPLNVGGLIGYSQSTIANNVYATGDVSAGFGEGREEEGGGPAGGLVGENRQGIFTNAYATGNVKGNHSGGLVGINIDGTLANTYATGSVSDLGRGVLSGGLVGENFGIITNSYATGQVNCRGSVYCGGLVGRAYASGELSDGTTFTSSITNSFYNTDTSGYSDTGKGIGLTTAEMQDPFTFINAGWDFATAWGKSSIGENDGHMILRFQDATLYDNYVSLSEGTTTYGQLADVSDVTSTYGIDTSNVSINWGSDITATTNVGSYSYSDMNVVDITTSNAGGVYIDYGTDALTINQASITLSIADITKTYDGTTEASGTAFVSTGTLYGTDSLGEGSYSFEDKNAGTNKTVSISSILINDGNDGGNYAISYIDNTSSSIAQATISSITDITASDKTYDGTTTATLGTNNASFTGMIAGDVLSVASASGAFEDKNADTNKTINISGLSLSGTDAGNYTLATTTAVTTADINKATITATGFTVENKTYDGTTAATVDSYGSLTGIFSGDSVSTEGLDSANATFNNKNAGTNKTVTLNGISLTGSDSGNYTLDFTTKADISKATISAITGITAENKTYDNNTAATLNTSSTGFSGMITGDALSVASASGYFADKNVGTGKTVNINGLILGGLDANNYTLIGTTAVTSADITPITTSPFFAAVQLSTQNNEKLPAGFSTLSFQAFNSEQNNLIQFNNLELTFSKNEGVSPTQLFNSEDEI
jgi:filamentous hemagglutinin family protein